MLFGHMEKILISACLVGEKTRYDGGSNEFPLLAELSKKYELVPFCPEVEGGLPTPRDPAEIKSNLVVTSTGKDVTKEYDLGAQKALQACKFFGIRIAILKDGSPACGSRHIRDGSFKGNKIEGLGVTARLLIANGIKVYADTDSLEFLLGESEDKKNARLRKNMDKQNAKKEIMEQVKNGTITQDEADAKLYSQREDERAKRNKRFKRGGGHSFSKKPYRPYKKDGESDGERKSYGEHRSYSKPYGEHKGYGDRKPYGEHRSYGDRKPYGEHKSYGDKPYGERKSYGEHKNYGDHKPYGERKSYGDKPYGERKSYGSKPYGERKNYGDKKPYGEHKSYGDKPYGERKSYGEHKSYGDHKGYGGQKQYGEHKSYGDHKGYKSYGKKPYGVKRYSSQSNNSARNNDKKDGH